MAEPTFKTTAVMDAVYDFVKAAALEKISAVNVVWGTQGRVPEVEPHAIVLYWESSGEQGRAHENDTGGNRNATYLMHARVRLEVIGSCHVALAEALLRLRDRTDLVQTHLYPVAARWHGIAGSRQDAPGLAETFYEGVSELAAVVSWDASETRSVDPALVLRATVTADGASVIDSVDVDISPVS